MCIRDRHRNTQIHYIYVQIGNILCNRSAAAQVYSVSYTHLKKQGHRPLLTACDIYRPAAINQLQVVGSKAAYLSGKRTGLEMQMFYSLEELILYRLLFFAL